MGTARATIVLLSVFVCIVHGVAGVNPCLRKYFNDSFVCVCNATYCNNMEPLLVPAKGTYVKFESNKLDKRLEKSVGTLQPSDSITGMPGLSGLTRLVLTFNASKKYQEIKGFGCAMTDAAAINILSLSTGAQNNLMKAYFSEEGIEYNKIRVTIGSCDFSTHVYTYCDTKDDFELKTFNLTDEDYKLKIPLILRAIAMSKKPIFLLASPWGPPGWLKTNGAVNGGGTLKGIPGDKYHKCWANYFVRFFDAYKEKNLTFWAVTAQNEPTAGLVPNYSFQCLGFTPMHQRDFIATDLGPALANSAHSGVKLIVVDDRRQAFPEWPEIVMKEGKGARQYIAGFAVHWYEEYLTAAEASLDATHYKYLDRFLLATEACNGAELLSERGVVLGSWERGNRYSHSIIENLNHYVTGWIDWNAALDMQGGPNWVKNFVDSPIIVIPDKDEFYMQPMFFHMGHFSKFIPKGSQRVHLVASLPHMLETLAILRPDSVGVLVVLNKFEKDVPFTISDPPNGKIDTVSTANSIQTYMWH